MSQLRRSATHLLLVALGVELASPLAAQNQIVARAPTGATAAAEQLLAASAEPRRLQLLNGDDLLSIARRSCGRLTETYVKLLHDANRNAKSGEAIVPACFVARLDQRVKVGKGETWNQLAERTAGVAGSKTLSRLFTENALANTVSNGLWSLASSEIPPEMSEVQVPVSTEAVVYNARSGVDADKLAADLRAALNTPTASPGVTRLGDELSLAAGVEPLLKADALCPRSPTNQAYWPFDVSELTSALARNAARLGSASTAVVAVVDNGIDGVTTAAFPLEEFAVNDQELAFPDDQIDQDGNEYFDDVVGTNVFQQGPPAFYPGVTYPAHGSMMASLALGGRDFRAWRKSTSAKPRVQLRVVSIVRRTVTAGEKGNVESFSMPTEALGKAVRYAKVAKAAIINLSVSTENRLQEVEDALYNDPDLLLVVAAGNQATDLDTENRYPAALSRGDEGRRGRVVTVAAHNRKGCLSGFSGRGVDTVDIAAPGEEIHAIGLGGADVVDDGTSQATALVSFTAAQLRAAGLTSAAAIKERIYASARLNPAFIGLVRSEGQLDPARALSLFDDALDASKDKPRMYGRLAHRPAADEVCPSLSSTAGEVLKVSRRIDGGTASEVRVLLRLRKTRGAIKVVHCKPSETPFSITAADGLASTFRFGEISDLVVAN